MKDIICLHHHKARMRKDAPCICGIGEGEVTWSTSETLVIRGFSTAEHGFTPVNEEGIFRKGNQLYRLSTDKRGIVHIECCGIYIDDKVKGATFDNVIFFRKERRWKIDS